MSRVKARVQKQLVVAHLTTVDLSLRLLLWPQLLAVLESGAVAYGISSPGPWVEELEEVGVNHVVLASSTRVLTSGERK